MYRQWLNRELSWCQLCRYWWHRNLSIKLASEQLLWVYCTSECIQTSNGNRDLSWCQLCRRRRQSWHQDHSRFSACMIIVDNVCHNYSLSHESQPRLCYTLFCCHTYNPLAHVTFFNHCPACRTALIATRFWVVVICPIIKCLTVLEFSFILFILCLFITIFNFILNYVPIVTFWIFTYHKIWILLIIFCFIWNYWIIYFLTCLEVFWSVVS